MIFIDERDDSNNPVERMFTQAIEQEASIIITTTHLLASFKDEWDLKKTLSGKKWSVKKLSDYFALLIPENLTEDLRKQLVQKNDNIPDSYVLGIRIPKDNLSATDIAFAKAKPLSKQRRENGGGFFGLSKHFIDKIVTNFIPSTEFAKFNGKILPPKYGLILVGHGEAYIPTKDELTASTLVKKEGLIAQLRPSDLRIFFDLLARGFNEKNEQAAFQSAAAFFLLWSCYSGDWVLMSALAKEYIKEIQKISFWGYKQIERVGTKNFGEITDFPFTIMTTTAFAAITKEALFSSYNFKKFYEMLLFCQETNYLTIMDSIYHADDPHNVALIKIPGVPWTSILDFKNNIVIIGRILAASRSANDPLYVSRYFKREKNLPAQPKSILVYPQKISFKVVIAKESGNQPFPDIFSMVPGPAKHEFLGGIEAPGFTLAEVVRGFIPGEIREYKLFFIKKITARDDIFGDGEKIDSLENVFIFHNRVFSSEGKDEYLDSKVSVFYSKGDISYSTTLAQTEFSPTGEEKEIIHSPYEIARSMENAEKSKYIPDNTKISTFLKNMENYTDPNTVYNVKRIEGLQRLYVPPTGGGSFGGGRRTRVGGSDDPLDLLAESLQTIATEKP